jgi:di/tricarboxylate transporter
MTPQITLILVIISSAVILFATEKLRVDLIALLVLLTLTLTGLVSPQEAFSGFANPAVVTVWAVYITLV